MGENLSNLQLFIGDRPIAFANSSSISFEAEKPKENKSWSQSYEASFEVKSSDLLQSLTGMQSKHNTESFNVVEVCLEYKVKRYPRKVKKAGKLHRENKWYRKFLRIWNKAHIGGLSGTFKWEPKNDEYILTIEEQKRLAMLMK